MGNVTRIGQIRNACSIFVGKPKGKRRLGRPSRRREDNIRMDLGEIGWKSVDWIRLVQDRDQCRVRAKLVLAATPRCSQLCK